MESKHTPATTIAHHPDCIAEQAWDIPEAYEQCSCGGRDRPFFPRRVCVRCWRVSKLCCCAALAAAKEE
jgi:hypothetical protein